MGTGTVPPSRLQARDGRRKFRTARLNSSKDSMSRGEAEADASEDQGTTWRKDFDLVFERAAL